jgi:hypothetical protein
MDVQVFVIDASHLAFGAFATFCAILLWSRTRDMGWTFIIVAAIVSYAGTVFATLVSFGILEEGYFSVRGFPLVRVALTDLPLFFMAVGFLIVMSRKKIP